MKKLRVILVAIIVFIISTAISVNMLFHSDEILINFQILKVTNNYTKYTVEFSEVKAAHHYVIQIRDENNRKVFEKETKKTTNELDLTNLITDQKYRLIVIAYDKLGDYRPCEEEYVFTWNEPTFSDELSLLTNNQDYKLIILGDLSSKEYTLNIKDGDNEILNEIITENEYTISADLYKDLEKELVVKLLCENEIVDELHLFNNMNPVTDVTITKPITESVIPYNDITISYTGGDNAEVYEIKIFKDKTCIKTSTTSKKNVILSKKLFKIAETYRVQINAKYQDYVKSSEIVFTMSEQEQLAPVSISNNWKYVLKGTKLTLKSNDPDAKIYYTLNGDNPESKGKLYTEPIEVNENVTLKTVAVLEGKINSVISTYDINIGKKETLKVYLSPSNQHGNLGVSSVGYTNEMDEMNDLTNYIQERLESNGVTVYRNNSAGNINQWNMDSIYYGVDFKIAIHSNASNEHDKYGIETWIDTQDSKTFSIANKIQDNLMSIYPYSDKEGANRGVKYANGALGEANDLYAPFQLLVEIAHHDYKDDAEWMMQNKKLIGYNIADSILEYYQFMNETEE